jgi:(2Fe-2S) ferredoxin
VAKKTAKELLKRATAKPVRNVCWYDKVTDKDAREFVEEIKAAREKGEYVNTSEVSRILHEHFKVTIGIGRVASHLKGECSCARR